MSKGGNVRRDEGPKVQEVPQFEKGDVVALTAAVIRRRDYANMTPRLLYEIGHPNEFLVLGVFETPETGPCIKLECCKYYEDRQKGTLRCTAHPAECFQKVKKMRMPKKGDKSSSIHLPFMQHALAGLHWEDDENSPAIKAQVLGKEIALTGPLAKILKQIAEENNIL